jgi:Acyl-CoA dehydrogenase, C-terminal domain
MDFQLTDSQVELRDATRKLCSAAGVARVGWDDLAAAGVLSLAADGFGLADAAVVFEELGRWLAPGPLVWSHLAGLTATGVEAGARLVEHLDVAEAVFVLADGGVSRIDPAALAGARALDPLDPGTPVSEVASWPAGQGVGGPDVAARWRAEGTVLSAALLAGVARGACELAVDYCRRRRQFDRPVGSFQAVKHLLADMLVRAEVARAAAWAAAADGAGSQRMVAAAKAVAGHAALANGAAGVQAHGGMGFTWEVDAHRYLERAHVLDLSFGTADEHADAVAAMVAGAQ